MKPKLLIVTGSPFKFGDLALRLNEFFDCEQKEWDEHEIQGDPEEIVKHKAKRAYEKFKQPVLVDDVSVSIGELNGFPGPYMKDFWKCFTPYEMGVKFAGSRVSATCYLGLCRGEGDVLIAEGMHEGKIIAPKHNEHQGRNFELFVQLDGTDKVMLEFTPEERTKFSHRGKAIRNLLEIL
ncbi:non-canonical purine NTP pyrophosphatase [Candidatus Nomurabacteria bacterium]|nr:non-canonical purine NTP pyrophosphatase [Candidatus Nomurabacteria bacterium]